MDKLKQSRLKLITVFTLFLGPLAIAFIWYYGIGASMLPKGQTNHANLIAPVVQLSPFSDTFSDEKPFTLDSLKRRWTVVHIISGTCGEECKTALYNTRQTRIAVGKDANRIQRIVLLEDSTQMEEIQLNHADILISVQSVSALLPQLQSIVSDNKLAPNDAIMVDPLGNVMMSIPLDLDPSLLLKDLKKLLKLSRVG